ncbi:rho guanine nucleotide exchange factor 12-like, partial [Plakobranchus ocellatus]
MPLNRKWRSMDFFGSLENLSKGLASSSTSTSIEDNSVKLRDKGEHEQHHHHHHHHLSHHLFHIRNPFKPRLANVVAREEPVIGSSSPHAPVGGHGGSGSKEGEPPDSSGGLIQRIVIIQRDEKGYGFTVSGDNPVFVASVKADGAASKAGVQQGDRILKVNGTLVTNRNHLDVVKLIKSGSYVALALLGKPVPSGGGPSGPASNNTPAASAPNTASNRDSGSGRVTAPQPVDPDKDRELQQQKINMTRSMYETAKEDFEKLQRQYVAKPSDRLHTTLLEKERTVKALENQFKLLTGAGDESSMTSSLSRPGSNRFSDSEHGGLESSVQSLRDHAPMLRHVKQGSVPSLVYRSREDGKYQPSASAVVARSKSDAAGRRSKTASTFYVGFQSSSHLDSAEAKRNFFQLKRASSLPTNTSDLGSMSDSPHTSPSVSPTPNDPAHARHNGQEMADSMIGSSSQDIITIYDEDILSEEDQHHLNVSPLPLMGSRPASPCITTVTVTGPETNDPGPFADIKLLESRPAHLATLLNYLISNSEPAPVLFHIISDSFNRVSGSAKELRKWAYEIYSTFIAQMAPLCIGVDDSIINQIDSILNTSASKTDNESTIRNMFVSARQSVQQEIGELLGDFRNKKDLGMANFYGFHKLHDNMDRSSEIKVCEDLLIPILETVSVDDNNRNVRDRDQAIGWALATFLRQVAGSKSAHSSTLDRVQTFMMKDKRSIKFPGSKSSRAKGVKGHQLILQHFYVTTFCNHCSHLIWGVGYQGYQCQSCEIALHKHCAENITETCGGKQKRRVSKLMPVIQANRRPSSNSGPSALSQQQMGDQTGPTTQPYQKEDDTDLAGLSSGHSVKSIVNRYERTSPSDTPPGLEVPGMQGKADSVAGPGGQSAGLQDRKAATDLSRSGSLNNKGE